MAALSLAHRLVTGPYPDASILIVDPERKAGNDRTWCYWSCRQERFDAIAWRRWRVLAFRSRFHQETPHSLFSQRRSPHGRFHGALSRKRAASKGGGAADATRRWRGDDAATTARDRDLRAFVRERGRTNNKFQQWVLFLCAG